MKPDRGYASRRAGIVVKQISAEQIFHKQGYCERSENKIARATRAIQHLEEHLDLIKVCCYRYL